MDHVANLCKLSASCAILPVRYSESKIVAAATIAIISVTWVCMYPLYHDVLVTAVQKKKIK
jgi:hypothetical protein